MKHCPMCGSSYTDDTLVYCLQDGATLQRPGEAADPLSMATTLREDTRDAPTEGLNHSSAPTAKISSSAMPTALYQPARPTAPNTGGAAEIAAPPANATRVVLVTVVATILLLGLGGIGAWMLFRGGGDGRGRERRSAQENSANTPYADKESETNAQNTPRSANQTRGANRADRGGRWFVILGSFPKAETGQAEERLGLVRREGFDARIVSSDDYPNMKAGLLVIVMGPYTRNNAEEVLGQVRPKFKDAYAKSGW
jgi:hypothetical protein